MIDNGNKHPILWVRFVNTNKVNDAPSVKIAVDKDTRAKKGNRKEPVFIFTRSLSFSAFDIISH